MAYSIKKNDFEVFAIRQGADVKPSLTRTKITPVIQYQIKHVLFLCFMLTFSIYD